MKSSTILFATLVGASLLIGSSLSASPRAAEASGAHYLLAAENLEGWHLGGFYRYSERELGHRDLSQNKYLLHVGYDLLDWVSVYGLIGSMTMKAKPSPWDSDTTAEYGGGAWINLLDHDLLNGLNLETKVRLQALGQITAARPDLEGHSASYVEFYSSLTLNLVNELIGNKYYWPEAIGIFGGPVLDKIKSDDFTVTGSKFGMVAGIDLYLSRATTLSLSYEAFSSDKAFNAAVNIRF